MALSLVTGGAGFIGAHVVRHLLEEGHEVIVLDDLSGGFMDNIPPAATFIRGSICDHELIEKIFSENKVDFVFHLAAYAAEGLSHFIRRFNYNNNLIGSVNLINEAVKNKVKCFVFTSSIAVYGRGQLPMREDMLPVPEDPYGISKLAVEMDLRCAHELFGLDYIIFRPHNVYGEYQNIGDKYRNVVGIFMNQLMQGNPLTIFGDGSQTRAFSYIGDVAPYIAGSIKNPSAYNQIFNIGADDEFTVNDLATAVCESMGMQGNIRYMEARNEVQHAYADHSKARELLGVATGFTLREGLKRMADWARMAGVRNGERFNNIEISEKLPPLWLEA